MQKGSRVVQMITGLKGFQIFTDLKDERKTFSCVCSGLQYTYKHPTDFRQLSRQLIYLKTDCLLLLLFCFCLLLLFVVVVFLLMFLFCYSNFQYSIYRWMERIIHFYICHLIFFVY